MARTTNFDSIALPETLTTPSDVISAKVFSKICTPRCAKDLASATTNWVGFMVAQSGLKDAPTVSDILIFIRV